MAVKHELVRARLGLPGAAAWGKRAGPHTHAAAVGHHARHHAHARPIAWQRHQHALPVYA
eukprot:227425-Chlamydomonas_euryale.AAC.1